MCDYNGLVLSRGLVRVGRSWIALLLGRGSTIALLLGRGSTVTYTQKSLGDCKPGLRLPAREDGAFRSKK